MLPRVRETAAAAHALGVPVVAATDTGYGSESVLRLSHELIELVGIGMSEFDAIRAATTVAAELLGIADRTGRVSAGFEADLLVLDRNPLDDIGQYQDVLFVMSDGVVALDRLDFRADEIGGAARTLTRYPEPSRGNWRRLEGRLIFRPPVPSTSAADRR